MAGKRLLDAALFLNGATKVGREQLRIGSQRLDVWSKTSSIGKAVKDQTDRVTLTVRAAQALSQRLNEKAPEYAKEAAAAAAGRERDGPDTVPRQGTVDNTGTQGDTVAREGLQQDHHYKREEENAKSDKLSSGEMSVKQKEATQAPTQDGTIPPPGTPLASEPLYQSDLRSADTVRSIPEREGIPAQDDDLPEGINTDVFFSPKLSKKMGVNARNRGPNAIGLSMPSRTPVEWTSLQQGKDQDTFNIRDDGSSAVSQQNEAAARPSQPVDQAQTADAGSSPNIADVKKESNQAHDEQEADKDIHELAADLAKDSTETNATVSEPGTEHKSYEMHESRVPSSRFGRLWQYGGLATSMAFGAVGETFRRATGNGSGGSLMLSAANMERLVAKLSRMRGAALKLGQMMSFQDSKMLPAPIHDVLQRVQDNADYMPASQRNHVLTSNLGSSWSDLFSSFDEVPFAAASIGQVHRATLASSNTAVAVKIQYPGVASSISSDLSNLSVLLTASRLLPKGLYLEKTIANARTELAWECDYRREASCQERFREILASESDVFTVPAVVHEASGDQVLTSEMMHGTAVTKPSLNLTQAQRDWIGTQILRLCLRELTEFRFMQTDPNWTNFLFNKESHKLELLDFGAARDYPPEFVDPYVRILVAAAHGDRQTVKELSVQLGYLTGHESRAMVDAHLASVMTLAEPFSAKAGTDNIYDFRDQTITDRVREQIPVMLRERLAPPPEETYSLHRKLSGAFLLLAKLGSRVRCREMFVNATSKWEELQQASAVT